MGSETKTQTLMSVISKPDASLSTSYDIDPIDVWGLIVVIQWVNEWCMSIKDNSTMLASILEKLRFFFNC